MATVTSDSTAIPLFIGLKPGATTRIAKLSKLPAASCTTIIGVKALLKDVGITVATTVLFASNAMAVEVLLGSDDGSLAFVPNDFSISAREKITFKNNPGFPHNVVFDQDEITSGVKSKKISMPEEDLLNNVGEKNVVTLNVVTRVLSWLAK